MKYDYVDYLRAVRDVHFIVFIIIVLVNRRFSNGNFCVLNSFCCDIFVILKLHLKKDSPIKFYKNYLTRHQ